jgi:hypothetical protein
MLELKGQWIGKYNGTNSGIVLLNLDKVDSGFEGYAYALDDNQINVDAGIQFYISNEQSYLGSEITLNRVVYPVNRLNGLIASGGWDEVKHLYDTSMQFPQSVTVNIKISNENQIAINWISSLGTNATGVVQRHPLVVNEKENVTHLEQWQDFKHEIDNNPVSGCVYRGQSQNFPLSTSFHRNGRFNIYKYLNEDITLLYKRLSQYIGRLDLNNPDEFEYFLNLAQHHGYPTPLLDWTYSPYVAAYFAFSSLKPEDISKDKEVVIFCFDLKAWKSTHDQITNLRHVKPLLTFKDHLVLNNDRMIPQQAVTAFTNIHNIEHFIDFEGGKNGKEYLRKYAIPTTEAHRVMRDLKLMGITKSSLFPGIDGICSDLKDELFEAI